MITTHRVELQLNAVEQPDWFENGDRIDLSSVRLEVEGARTFASFDVDMTYRISDENEAKADAEREFYSAYGAETGINLALLDAEHLARYRQEYYQFPTE